MLYSSIVLLQQFGFVLSSIIVTVLNYSLCVYIAKTSLAAYLQQGTFGLLLSFFSIRNNKRKYFC